MLNIDSMNYALMIETKYPINTTIGHEDLRLMPLSSTDLVDITLHHSVLSGVHGSTETTLPVCGPIRWCM